MSKKKAPKDGLEDILPPLKEQPITLLGSSKQPATFDLEDGTTVQLGDVVNEAFKLAQPATIDQWNAMPDEEREAWIQQVVDEMPLKFDKVDTGIKEAGAFGLPYDPSLADTNIETLAENLTLNGCVVNIERLKDKAGVDHYNVTATRDMGDKSLQFSGRIEENATPNECMNLFDQAVKDLGLAA